MERNLPPLLDVFGIRSAAQLRVDLGHVLGRLGRGFQVDLSSVKHLRPDLSLSAYAGRVPTDGLSPIMNLFDRVGGGRGFTQRVTKKWCRDFREGALTYDEHDGTDFVCPVATPIVAAAPGRITLLRDRWLRGGLTLTVDHGAGLTTQYTHLSRALLPVGSRVRRGEVIALSGASGIDMTTFFPWVAPHLHFMAWHAGRPVDPFLAPGEETRSGTWETKNTPRPAGREEDAFPEAPVDAALANELSQACKDPGIQQEIAQVRHEPLSLVALLEDSFHHDRFAWPETIERSAGLLRRPSGEITTLTLPLDPKRYQGTRMADAWGSEPTLAGARPPQA